MGLEPFAAEFTQKLAHLAKFKVNQFLHPIGLNLFPIAWPPSVPGTDRASVFDSIFASNMWGSCESRSGPGSARDFTRRYGPRLTALVRRMGWRSMLDAPCGDLAWMSDLLTELSIEYIGGDVSKLVVEEVKAKHPQLDVRVFDICRDQFPLVDVWHCRDCFFHLPEQDIRSALQSFLASGIPWALLTTHRGLLHRNLDVAAGGFRLLDLERPPFSFPPAVEYIADFRPGREYPRYVGLWPRDSIARALGA